MALGCECLSWPVLLFLAVAAYLIYMCWNFRLFTNQGVPMCGTPVPIFGNSLLVFLKGFIGGLEGNFEKYGKTYGGMGGREPMLTTADIDILKEVFIKDHVSFPHRYGFVTGDPLDDNMVGAITDYAHWKSLRSTLSPTFSSGKLKRMMKQINKCAATYAGHLAKECEKKDSVEMKDVSGTFTMDVIASTAFGLDLNTKDDRNNEFVQHATKAFNISLMNPQILVAVFAPFLAPLLKPFKYGFIDKESKVFFKEITNQILESRKDDKGEDRIDFIRLMMNAHKEEGDDADKDDKSHKRPMTHQEILSQAVLFFVAGYDTTATTVSFLAYNLALNPDKQDSLIEEVQKVIGDKEEVTDEDLHNMPYLDMCVSESLRLFPPAVRTDRIAARDVVLKGIFLPKGSIVVAPIYHIHRLEEFYPDPQAFIPERFSPEEKAKRDPMLYMPFGAGPRQCLATRLALLEVKLAITHVLKTHHFVKAPETQVPPKFAPGALLKMENGVWLRIEKNRK